ncbi:MAG: metallophosphoesterase family protein [Bacteroidales bacterium]|nr:metallophosphoesterase family protein [Bacteroidales bacterium]
MKLALISDIHEDVVNLKLALYKLEKQGCDEVVCLGDISGFSVPHYRYFDTRDAHECLRLVRENCRLVVLGNHDLQAAGRLPAYCPDFNFPANWYSLDYHQRKELGYKKVWLYDHDELDPLYTLADKEYLSSLPEFGILEAGNRKLFLSHYVYPNLSGSLLDFYHTAPEYRKHLEFMNGKGCRLGFGGHFHAGGLTIATHEKLLRRGFRRKVKPPADSVILVPSVAGNKMNNGFCIFDTDEDTVRAVHL